MKALVTGGEGYIGRNLVKFLWQKDISYKSFDLKNHWNILDIDMLSHAMHDIDICFHLAALPGIAECEQDPTKALETNLLGTHNVMDAAWQSEHEVKVVFTSSFALYHPKNRDSVYGLSKALGERIVIHYGGVVCRISNVYGGEKFTELKDSVISRLMRGDFEDRGHGAETRDFVHVHEVCEKLLKAAELQPRTIADICTNTKMSIAELQTLSRKPGFPENMRKPAHLIIK